MFPSLTASSADGRCQESSERSSHLASVATYLSDSLLTRRLRKAKGQEAIGEFVEGTLLFADISGFTALSEQMAKSGREGAEELTALLNEYFEAMIDIIVAHDGDVLQFGGDSLLAVFGVTDAAENVDQQAGAGREPSTTAAAVLKAIGCGLSMQKGMQRFERLETACGVFPLCMRIAVHRGRFLLGGAGSGAGHLQQITTGPTLSRLAEVETLAQPGEVLITSQAAEAVGDRAQLAGAREGCFQVAGLTGEGWAECSSNKDFGNVWRQFDQVEADAAETILRAYLIPAVYRRIVEDPTGYGNEGEHRHITTMFVHFAGLSDAMWTFGGDGALRAVRILDEYLSVMTQVIDRHGGALARVSADSRGDKLLILFGAPLAIENPEQNALHCALEMNRRLEELNREFSVAIQQRIAITAGNAFCGNVGSNRRREYTVIGDHVNAASRLMATAAFSEILLTANVWQKTRESFRFAFKDSMKLRGIEQPLRVYQLLSERNRRLSKVRISQKLVGREEQCAKFQGVVERVLAGEGQLVLVSGEPGVGKSRLVEEFITNAKARDMSVFLGQCDHNGNRTAYLPWGQVLRDFVGIGQRQSLESSKDRLETKLAEAGHDLRAWFPLLGTVLGIAIPDNERTSLLTPRQRKEKIFDILVDLLRAQAGQGPVLIVLEDVHWIDPLSKELLMRLSAAIGGHRILILAVHRSDFELLLGSTPENLHRLEVLPFSSESTAELLKTLLGTSDIPDELTGTIQNKTRGNPLFVEEMVRVLLEARHLVRDENTQSYLFSPDRAAAGVPDTVQNLILSRVDRLGEEPRKIIQVAAVFGKSFRRDPLHSVLHFHLEPDGLESRLREIAQLELIVPEDSTPHGSYAFRHALVQEAIYESIAFARRREIHRLIGEELERLYDDEAPAQCEELSRHFDLGRDGEKALKYLLLAGDKAKAASANAQAADYYERALAHLVALESRNDPRLLSRLLEDLGDVHSLGGNYPSAIQRYQQCLEGIDEPVRRAHLEGKLGGVAYRQGQPELGIQHLERGLLNLAIRAPRTRWQVRASLIRQALIQAAHTLLPRIFVRDRSKRPSATCAAIEIYEALSRICYESDLERTLDAHLRQLNLCETIPDSAQMAQTYSSHGIVCGTIPLFHRAIRYQQRGLAIREARGDRWGVAQSSNFMGISYYWMGCYQEAIICLQRSALIFKEVGDRWETQVTHLILSYVYMRRGELDQALGHARTSLDLGRRADDSQGMGWALGALAEVYSRQGKLEDALAHARRAIASSEQAHDRMYLAVIRRILGEIHLRRKETDQAIQEMRESVQQIKDYRLRQEYVMGSYSALAEACLAAREFNSGGKPDPSGLSLRQIKTLCRQGLRQAKKYPNWLGYAYRVSALCEEAAGRPLAAERYFRRSIEASRSLGADYDLGMSTCELGRLLCKHGDPASRGCLEEARRLFQKCGAALDLSRAESLLAEAPPPAEAGTGLPPRPHLFIASHSASLRRTKPK